MPAHTESVELIKGIQLAAYRVTPVHAHGYLTKADHADLEYTKAPYFWVSQARLLRPATKFLNAELNVSH